MTLTPLTAIRERAEKATKEQLIDALMLAVEQRDSWIDGCGDHETLAISRDADAALAAILEPEVTP